MFRPGKKGVIFERIRQQTRRLKVILQWILDNQLFQFNNEELILDKINVIRKEIDELRDLLIQNKKEWRCVHL